MHWVAVGALALAGAGFVTLGLWQLERAEVNRAIAERFHAAATLPPLEWPVTAAGAGAGAGVDPDTTAPRYRQIRLRGHYVPDRQVLLDNMTSHGVAGYQVLTPLRVGGERLVLVNRGWVPASPDRSRLPDVALEGRDEIVVRGRIDDLPRAALDLGQAEVLPGGAVVVLSYPDFPTIEAALGVGVHRFQLLLDPAAPEGFTREWGPSAGRAERNIAYAVQWFGLAALAAVIAIGMAVRHWRRSGEAAA
jgi:surfeit locus 1 family protein